MRVYTCLVASVLVALPVGAQGPAPVGLRQHVVQGGSVWTPSFARDSTPANHWKEGVLIGAGVGVAFALLIAATGGVNGVGDSKHGISVLGAIGGLTLFSFIGGLIGSSVHKRE